MSKGMWYIHGICIHLIFLGSIFVIYFRSPIIRGLQPQRNIDNPPASRVVLFVTDGLRRESFFRNHSADIPNIRKIFENKGILGISHTRVPTESRPGHIALIAGFYEDPSAVTRGWKENPVDFDSIFNRSQLTYAFGANEVIGIFTKDTDLTKIKTFTYDHDLDFSGQNKSYLLDIWVFSKVEEFLRTTSTPEIVQKNQVIFFLHLLGLDTAGHVFKPGTKDFIENLKITDDGIYRMYNLFEKYFPDKRTAYILTSDHGMSNSGSHGGGHHFETETPFFAWGAGMRDWKFTMDDEVTNNRMYTEINSKKIPLYEIEQANLAPLMSALIGSPPPMNNIGILPVELMNAPPEYLAEATSVNALQILAQYTKLLSDLEKGSLFYYLPKFSKIDSRTRTLFGMEIDALKSSHSWEKVIEESKKIITVALEGIEYYHTYYKMPLLICTCLSFSGWMLNLILDLNQNDYKNSDDSLFHSEKYSSRARLVNSVMLMIFTVSVIILILQRIPIVIGFYLVLPIFCWMQPMKKINSKFIMLKRDRKSLRKIFNILLIFIGAEFLVFSFFHRWSVAVIMAIFCLIENKFRFNLFYIKSNLKWIISLIIIFTFPFYPSANGNENVFLFTIGAFIWFYRPFYTKLYQDRMCLVFSITCIVNVSIILISIKTHSYPISVISLITSWWLALSSIICPMLTKRNPSHLRIQYICHYLSGLYMLLSVSYEMIFLEFLKINLEDFIRINCIINKRYEKDMTEDEDGNNYYNERRKYRRMNLFSAPSSVSSSSSSSYIKKSLLNRDQNLDKNFRIAFSILLFIFLSFFGTGNMATISSFDPTIIRCFLTTFKPFLITALVIVKLFIPVVLILTHFSEYCNTELDKRQIFTCILIICDIMGMNFLFMVTNKGSWLEIGTSISHFVIMEGTTFFLLLTSNLTRLLINFDLLEILSKRRSYSKRFS